VLILRGDIPVAAEADPAILNGADLPHLQQVSNKNQLSIKISLRKCI